LKRRRAATMSSAAPVKYDQVHAQPSQTLLNNLKFMEKLAEKKAEPLREIDQRAAAATSSGALMSGMVSNPSAYPQMASSSSASSSSIGPAIRPPTYIRHAADKTWEDKSLLEWDPNDHRIFVGDVGNECTDELLAKTFARYPSFKKARIVRDKITQKTKGYGFVSFGDAKDFVLAIKELNGKYIGNKPCKLRKSTWADRNDDKKMKKIMKHAGKQQEANKPRGDAVN